jgi:signal transduction histidine kinase
MIYAYLVRTNFWLRGHITTGLTHELKSPLGAIQGATEIILETLRKPADNREKAIEYTTMIQQNTKRLDVFVKNLLDVARTQEGPLTIQKRVFDLKKTAESTVDSYRVVAEQKGIDMVLEMPDSLEMEGDPEKIHQALSNLLSNAVKFSDGGRISVVIARADTNILCSVSDQGCGIKKQYLEKVFDRFFQINPSQKGSGIGLAIAKAWIEAHDGKIWVESEEGRGTTVAFTLPSTR